MNEDDVCFVDCATMHTILRDKRYFLELTLIKANVSTISGTTNIIEGSRKASKHNATKWNKIPYK